MAGVTDFISSMSNSARKVQDRVVHSNNYAERIGETWQGNDERAFQEAYRTLKSSLSRTLSTYERINGRLSSLQSSIEAAERDKEEKRRQRYR